MRSVAELADYLADSGDACFVSRNFSTFHALPALFGLVVWGKPDVAEADLAMQARDAELADRGQHDMVLDYRLLEAVEHDVFGRLGDWVAANAVALARCTNRAALLAPQEPFAAAVVAGFYSVFSSPYPSKLCSSVEEAEEWLQQALHAPLAAVHALAIEAPMTRALREVLDRSPGLTIHAAAAELATSERTLQRRLADEGTTFRIESRRACVRVAKRLLATTDMKIADIAIASGCSTPQHFNDLFRDETGVTPALWRRRRQG